MDLSILTRLAAKSESNEFYIHHTISRDMTGGNDAVKTEILSALANKEKRNDKSELLLTIGKGQSADGVFSKKFVERSLVLGFQSSDAPATSTEKSIIIKGGCRHAIFFKDCPPCMHEKYDCDEALENTPEGNTVLEVWNQKQRLILPTLKVLQSDLLQALLNIVRQNMCRLEDIGYEFTIPFYTYGKKGSDARELAGFEYNGSTKSKVDYFLETDLISMLQLESSDPIHQQKIFAIIFPDLYAERVNVWDACMGDVTQLPTSPLRPADAREWSQAWLIPAASALENFQGQLIFGPKTGWILHASKTLTASSRYDFICEARDLM
jgi:hypothetical protein